MPNIAQTKLTAWLAQQYFQQHESDSREHPQLAH
jgi:hypothetical protein